MNIFPTFWRPTLLRNDSFLSNQKRKEPAWWTLSWRFSTSGQGCRLPEAIPQDCAATSPGRWTFLGLVDGRFAFTFGFYGPGVVDVGVFFWGKLNQETQGCEIFNQLWLLVAMNVVIAGISFDLFKQIPSCILSRPRILESPVFSGSFKILIHNVWKSTQFKIYILMLKHYKYFLNPEFWQRISVGDIPLVVGWYEKLGHRNQPQFKMDYNPINYRYIHIYIYVYIYMYIYIYITYKP